MKVSTENLRKEFAWKTDFLANLLKKASKSAENGEDDFDRWLTNNDVESLWETIKKYAIVNKDRREQGERE